MELIMKKETQMFDASVIRSGMLLYGKHNSWTEGRQGFISHVEAQTIAVRYHSGVGNVINHYFIPVSEVIAGEWEIRWSDHLEWIETFDPVHQEDG